MQIALLLAIIIGLLQGIQEIRLTRKGLKRGVVPSKDMFSYFFQ